MTEWSLTFDLISPSGITYSLPEMFSYLTPPKTVLSLYECLEERLSEKLIHGDPTGFTLTRWQPTAAFCQQPATCLLVKEQDITFIQQRRSGFLPAHKGRGFLRSIFYEKHDGGESDKGPV
jgi:hypothetical protein